MWTPTSQARLQELDTIIVCSVAKYHLCSSPSLDFSLRGDFLESDWGNLLLVELPFHANWSQKLCLDLCLHEDSRIVLLLDFLYLNLGGKPFGEGSQVCSK